MLETEIIFPDFGDICFRAKCELRQEFIKWQILELKAKHQRAIENQEYDIVLSLESKIHLTETFLKDEYLKLKKVV